MNTKYFMSNIKQRLKEEGNETVTICHGLKVESKGNKKLK